MPCNTKKFYRSGKLGKQTRYERYQYVLYTLAQHLKSPYYDLDDLKWALQNSMCFSVYISEKAAALGSGIFRDSKDKFILEMEDSLLKTGSFEHQNAGEIRKMTKNCVVYEHVVPTKLHLKKMIELYEEKKFSFEVFEQMSKKLHICLVTKEEDKLLTSSKLRQSMPDGADWFDGDEWARYKKVGIELHKI